MERIPWRCCAALALIATTGCANLEAKKVPLADRLCGKDEHVKGFRYYVSRPYVVVSQRVCVWQNLSVGRLLAHKSDNKRLYIETIDVGGKRLLFNTQGQLAEVDVKPDDLVEVLYPAKAAETDKPKEIGGLGTPPVAPPKPAPKPIDTAPQTLSFAALRKVVADETPIPTFQYVMLPDFEEQIAIHDNNFAAKGKYELKFADGWQLRSVNGSWDSTEVAVKALQVLGNAVSAAADVRKEQLDKLPIKKATDPAAVTGKAVLAVVVQARYIEPGIYRIQKNSERQGASAGHENEMDATCAILADLGFPAQAVEVNTYLVAD